MAMGESTSSRDRPARWAKRIARIDTYSTAESVVPCRTRCHASDDARRHGCKAVYDPFNSWKSIPQDIPATTRAAPRTRPMRSEKARGEVRGSPPCGTLSPGMDEAETDAHEHAWTTMAAMQTTPQLSTTGTSASKQTEHPNARDDAMGTATSSRSGRASRHRFQSAWNASATAVNPEIQATRATVPLPMRCTAAQLNPPGAKASAAKISIATTCSHITSEAFIRGERAGEALPNAPPQTPREAVLDRLSPTPAQVRVAIITSRAMRGAASP